MGGHHTVDPGSHGGHEGNEMEMEFLHALIGYDRGKVVRVQFGKSKSGKMLCGCGNSVRLQSFDPDGSEVRYSCRSRTK